MQYSFKKVFNFIRLNDILHLFLAFFILPWALIAKIFIRNFWLVCEDKNEARDNGYWLYKWIRENKPKQKIAYAINKKSPDYIKIKELGKVISYGTLSHWFWYIVADKNISSQKGGKPNAAVCYLFEVVLGLRKNNRIFLQHGIIINNCEWLHYKNTKIKLFITSTVQEYHYIVEQFKYPANNVVLTGLARYDNLSTNKTDEDLILVMPSWRNWLGRQSHENSDLDFTTTKYFQCWNELLNSEELDALLEKKNKRIIFYPHRNMQKFLNFFKTKSSRIEIADWKNNDVQDLLKRANLLITDYSSVFFDFAYMCKPIIFYQFDENEFRQKQYGEGYFDYHKSIFGEWAGTLNDVILILNDRLSNVDNKISSDLIKEIFPYVDNKNCERIFNAILLE